MNGVELMRWKVFGCLILCSILLIQFLPNLVVNADKGSVSISNVHIPIYEPGQKAIICWDGTEELLILTTDIKSEQSTKALEILPLPSEPKINISDIIGFK